ncbi:DNA mismatch endonuclease Vsr [Sphingomonas sp. MAH-20]|uniref:DNA mismatch endonuclease Vsr n=2 Tax=Sphingomonadaceae TaxID=41297 RepID=A0A6I4IZH6_9SPHN|nr:DNA mismatch endonuclease Vsr [Sphingomonas sp. CGMCC 1.13658]MVO77575.1 DNA mismatch endonuclease Vsr [Sphingomonas horti]
MLGDAKASRADPLTPAQRRLCMSRIRAADTRPEMIVRRGLHALGLRYRLHDRQLPGTPDLVFPVYRAVIFVHGCFWHGHDCPLFRVPATRTEFWTAKISRNRERDRDALAAVIDQGWRPLIIWECAMRGRARLPEEILLAQVHRWIVERQNAAEIAGAWGAEPTG